MELFTELWESKKPEKRIKWIKEKADTDNPDHYEMLEDFAKNDKDRYVRVASIEKLKDQNLLADIAKNDQDRYVRETAIEKLKDQNLLADIAKNDKDYYIRQQAYAKLGKAESQAALADIANNEMYSDTRIAAVKKLKDQRLLADVAKNDGNSYIRRAAVEKLTDQKLLSDFAKNDKDGDIRAISVEKLTDHKLLADIAKNDEKFYVRQYAYKKLGQAESQDALVDIAKNANNSDVRVTAVKKITDQSLLADIAKNYKDSYIRKAAVEKLTDQKLLEDIAKNGNNESIRQVALKVLAGISNNDIHGRIREASLEKMVKIVNKTVKIGKQIWMAENLNVIHFRNGDPIPEVKSNEEWESAGRIGKPAWCYYENNPDNGKKYGKLYNWFAVNDPRGLAPEGWHLPSKAEFEILIENCGGEVSWTAPDNLGYIFSGVFLKLKHGGSSGFNSLFGGYRDGFGSFWKIEQSTFYWSTTQISDDVKCAYYLGILADAFRVDLNFFSTGHGFSIRFLKDSSNVRGVSKAVTKKRPNKSDGIVIDKNTGLMWQQEDDSLERDFNEALSYCRSLKLEGYSDWRLPTSQELKTIFEINSPTNHIDIGFKNAKAERYWSISKFYSPQAQEEQDVAFTFDFGAGQPTTYFRKYKYYVRAVRL